MCFNIPVESYPAWVWAAFLAFVAAMMILDLGIIQRRHHMPGFREAAFWSALWVGIALAFCGLIWIWRGPQLGMEFLTGYLIEESLSLDNLFVFLVIFRYFSLPEKHYRSVLTWGILGAIVLRAVMIFAGVAIINRFEWVILVLGAFLVYTAVKLVTQDEEVQVDLERSWIVRIVRVFLPVHPRHRHGSYFVKNRAGRWTMTTQLIVLLVVEATDVAFAVDSIPAIFAVTRDPFIIFTSNMLAVMGLRSIFFLMVGVLHRIQYLRHGLALVLGFIGVKMLAERWVHVPILASLAVVAVIIAGCVAISLLADSTRHRRK
jgi:tellurite resistance protein TerC